VIPLEEIRQARDVLAGKVLRTPLVRLDGTDVYLKLENLQPIGSFKLRGALNAVAGATPEQLRAGVVTGSAGNMGQGVAWAARELGVCTQTVRRWLAEGLQGWARPPAGPRVPGSSPSDP